jgi:hypothetical protein
MFKSSRSPSVLETESTNWSRSLRCERLLSRRPEPNFTSSCRVGQHRQMLSDTAWANTTATALPSAFSSGFGKGVPVPRACPRGKMTAMAMVEFLRWKSGGRREMSNQPGRRPGGHGSTAKFDSWDACGSATGMSLSGRYRIYLSMGHSHHGCCLHRPR